MFCRTFLVFLTLLFLLSCNQNRGGEQAEIIRLQRDVVSLQQQIDSLKLLVKWPTVNASKTDPATIKKPTKKKATAAVQTLYSDNSYSTPKKKTTGYSGQCLGITKKGSQCSRSARSGGYCWQHGG